MFGNRVPKWVRDLPKDSVDKELLMQLLGASRSPLDTPRKMNFVIMGLPSAEAAENAIAQIKQKGWDCRINPSEDKTGAFHLEASRKEYRITDAIFDDEAFMARIAKLYGATYDGWYAQVV